MSVIISISSGGIVLQKIVKLKVEVDSSQGPEFAHFKYLAGLVCVVVGLICKTIICALLPQLTLAALSAQVRPCMPTFIYKCIWYLGLHFNSRVYICVCSRIYTRWSLNRCF